MRPSRVTFLCLFLSIWTLFTLGFDIFLYGAPTFRAAIASSSWVLTSGTVREFHVHVKRDADSTTYTPIILFDYTVNHQAFVGDRINFTSSSGSSSQSRISAFKAQYVPGSTVRVYYDPANPAKSVLSLERDPTLSMLLLFLTPFNIIMIAGWNWLISRFLAGQATSVAGFRITRSPSRVVLRLSRVSPAVAGYCAAGISSFIAIFVIAFSTDMMPSKTAVIVTWTVVCVASLLSYTAQSRRQSLGLDALVIDRAAGTIRIPGRPEPYIAPLTSFDRCDIRIDASREINDQPTRQVLAIFRGALPEIIVATWLNDETSSDLARWLTDEIRNVQPIPGVA